MKLFYTLSKSVLKLPHIYSLHMQFCNKSQVETLKPKLHKICNYNQNKTCHLSIRTVESCFF